MNDPTTATEVRETLRRFISEIGKIPPEQIGDNATIDRDLQFQSLTFVELQVAIEEFYNIEIDPIAVVELNAFGAIADYVYAQITR